MALCDPCTKATDRWLFSRPQDVLPDFSRALRGGTGYDASAPGVVDARRARYERWRTLVRDNMQAIRAACAAGNHEGATV